MKKYLIALLLSVPQLARANGMPVEYYYPIGGGSGGGGSTVTVRSPLSGDGSSSNPLVISGPADQVTYWDHATGNLTSDADFTRDNTNNDLTVMRSIVSGGATASATIDGVTAATLRYSTSTNNSTVSLRRTDALFTHGTAGGTFGVQLNSNPIFVSGLQLGLAGAAEFAVINNHVKWLWPSADAAGCLQSDGAGNLSLGSCGTSGITYGGPVGGGAPNEVLYIDGSGNLASDTNFTRDSSQATTIIANGSGSSSRIAVDGTSGIQEEYLDIGETAQLALGAGLVNLLVTHGGNQYGVQIDHLTTPMNSGFSIGNNNSYLLEIWNNNGGTPWVWPTADGTADQALTTDGAGHLSFTGPYALASAGAPTYPLPRIPFGDGVTAGGLTSDELTFITIGAGSYQLSVGTASSADVGHLALGGVSGTGLIDGNALIINAAAGAALATYSPTQFYNQWNPTFGSAASGAWGFQNDGLNNMMWVLSANEGGLSSNIMVNSSTGIKLLHNGAGYIMPLADGSNGDVITTDGAGNLSFTSGSGLVPSLTSTQVAYGDASNLMTSDASFTRDPANNFQTVISAVGGATTAALRLTPLNSSTLSYADSGGPNTSSVTLRSNDASFSHDEAGALFGVSLSAAASYVSGLQLGNGGSPYFKILNNSVNWFWPMLDGNPGDVLSTDGAGNMTFIPFPASSVFVDAPLSGDGTTGNHIVISQSGVGTDGYLSSVDWNTFNNKVSAPVYPATEVVYGNGVAGGTTDPGFTRTTISNTYSEFNVTALDVGPSASSVFSLRPSTGIFSIGAGTGEVDELYFDGKGGHLSATDGTAIYGVYLKSDNNPPAFITSGIQIGTSTIGGYLLALYNGPSLTPWLWPTIDAAGALVSDGSGNLSFSAIAPAPIYAATLIPFGDGTTPGGTTNSNLTYDLGNDRFTLASSIDSDHGIFYNGTGAPNGLNAHRGLGMDFFSGAELYTLGNSTDTLILLDNDLKTITARTGASGGLLLDGINKAYGFGTGTNPTDSRVTISETSGFGLMFVQDSGHTAGAAISIAAGTDASIAINGNDYLDLNLSSDFYAIGDLGGSGNGTTFTVDNANQLLKANKYPNTRDDSGTFTPGNFLYTGAAGEIYSASSTTLAGILNAAVLNSTQTFTGGITIANDLTVTGAAKIGWERVVNACGAGVTTCTATCTGGNKATGGGCSTAAVLGVSVMLNDDGNDNSHTCTTLAATTISATVYCARIDN